MTSPLLSKLTLEEQDLFQDSMSSDIFNIYLKIINEIVADIDKDVLKYQLDKLDDASLGELAALKMRSQGARTLLRHFRDLKAKSKK